eukprot:Pgem_evm1s13108
MLSFEVIDTGCGINDFIKSRLFDPFAQGIPGCNLPYVSTGLGLALSKRLAMGMDGNITVESTVGKGSSFTFTLPIKIPLVGDEKKPVTCRPKKKPVTRRAKKKTSLDSKVSKNKPSKKTTVKHFKPFK